MTNKLETITKLFEENPIRSIWDSEKEDYYFSVVDVISALTDSSRPRKYWNDLKRDLVNEGSELSEKIGQLKMKSKDGKNYLTDTLDTEGIFRLIESVPSSKAEPFKLWLAKLGKERIDEVFDPEIAIKRSIEYYKRKGYTDAWIEARIKGILNRNKLTDVWKERGINTPTEYAILTNDIYKEWSGMTAKGYKEYKGLHKESLRDNMSDIEVALTDLGEITTRELAKKFKPSGLDENRIIAKKGGEVALNTRNNLEDMLGEEVITKNNVLTYQYNEDNNLLENKERVMMNDK